MLRQRNPDLEDDNEPQVAEVTAKQLTSSAVARASLGRQTEVGRRDAKCSGFGQGINTVLRRVPEGTLEGRGRRTKGRRLT